MTEISSKRIAENLLFIFFSSTYAKAPTVETSIATSAERPRDLKNAALEAEYETILKVLREVNFNKTKASKILNIDRKTLYNKMKAINLGG